MQSFGEEANGAGEGSGDAVWEGGCAGWLIRHR